MQHSPTPPETGSLEAGLRQQPWVRGLVYWLGAAIAVLHLVMNFSTLFSTQWQSALHFVGLGILAFLLYPPLRGRRMARSPVWLTLDLILGVLFVTATLWIVAAEDGIYERGVHMSTWEQGLALATIAAAIELTRRTTGPVIPVLIVLALSYVVGWGAWLDNVFKFAGLSNETLLFRSIYGDDALFGSISRISVSFAARHGERSDGA